jgi:hypothetical protein
VRPALALLGLLASQAGFVGVLVGGRFWTGYGLGAVVWGVALPAWAAGKRRWWPATAKPELALFGVVAALLAGSFFVAQGFSDEAYCSATLPPAHPGCWIPESVQTGFGWAGFFYVPVALATGIVAAMLARARPVPMPFKVGLVVVGMVVLAAIGFVALFFLTPHPPT